MPLPEIKVDTSLAKTLAESPYSKVAANIKILNFKIREYNKLEGSDLARAADEAKRVRKVLDIIEAETATASRAVPTGDRDAQAVIRAVLAMVAYMTGAAGNAPAQHDAEYTLKAR